MERPIVVGRVRKPHGLKGELAIFPLTDDPEGIFTVGREVALLDLHGAERGRAVIAQARVYHRECLLRFEGHTDRSAVEEWRNHFLAVPRDVLPPLAEGEVYVQELAGWSVQDEDGAALGLVTAVYELPQGPVIEVQGAVREFLLPFQASCILTTDREGQRLVVRIPPGLLD